MPCRCLPLAGVALLLGACSPALDWRDVRPESTSAVALFPCRPTRHARQVVLAQTTLRLSLYACTASGATWALAYADVADPARVAPALHELQAAAEANLGAVPVALPTLRVPGETPNTASGRFELNGRLPDGQPVREQMAVFARGTTVFQATALGERLEADALETFFTALRFIP